ncbi:MAG TPA: hypothetical protein VLK22_04065 [Candidatus Udaeobacter sp.]|nr:hypothetical protein [Candidatus Udaeobacter sp.]
MMIFKILGLMALGYFWSGVAIASLHRYAHKGRLVERGPKCPSSAAIYRAYHLAHHRQIHQEVTPCRRKLSVREWANKLGWAIGFALTNPRWIALRTLYAGTSIALFIVLTIAMRFELCSFRFVAWGSGAFLLGAFTCLLAYDLCHAWTHEGGPFPSKLHAKHHGRPSDNFGMWRWHNWANATTTKGTVWMLLISEKVATLIPPLRRRLHREVWLATQPAE